MQANARKLADQDVRVPSSVGAIKRPPPKGSCANCGSAQHKTKECVERPRKLKSNSMLTRGIDIAGADRASGVFSQPSGTEFEAKRDRWNGYEPEMQKDAIQKFAAKQKSESLSHSHHDQKSKTTRLDNAGGGEFDIADLSSSDSDDNLDDDSAKKKFKRAHNDHLQTLRIREDTVKYLRRDNEGVYDPKTRTWSQALQSGNGSSSVDLADNFVKWTGDAPDVIQMQVFAWDAHSKGVDVNLQADPTRAELLRKELDKKQHDQVTKISSDIELKYGHQRPFKRSQSIEFFQTQVVSGATYATIKSSSRIGEDDFEKYAPGHSAIWGSYFDVATFCWGYDCCRSLNRDEKCSIFR